MHNTSLAILLTCRYSLPGPKKNQDHCLFRKKIVKHPFSLTQHLCVVADCSTLTMCHNKNVLCHHKNENNSRKFVQDDRKHTNGQKTCNEKTKFHTKKCDWNTHTILACYVIFRLCRIYVVIVYSGKCIPFRS